MASLNKRQGVQVTCHSGHTYAQEPLSLRWEGQQYQAAEVEARWRTPEGAAFQVRTRSGERFALFYSEAEDEWVLRSLPDADPQGAKSARILPFP
jgi:hypothetical protein